MLTNNTAHKVNFWKDDQGRYHDHTSGLNSPVRNDDQGEIAIEIDGYFISIGRSFSGSMIKCDIRPEACKIKSELRCMSDEI